MYIGLVKYKLKEDAPDDFFRIGHQPTDNLERLISWKKTTESFNHVVECQIYELVKEE